MTAQSPVVNIGNVPMKTQGNDDRFVFRHCRVGAVIGMDKLGCGLFVVPPGKTAYPYHAHSVMEEMCIILEGAGTLRQDGEEYPVKAGDVIGSKVGQAHQIVNTSDADLRYLCVSNNEPCEVVHYPDSDKIGAISGAFGKTLWHFTRRESATGYYEGET